MSQPSPSPDSSGRSSGSAGIRRARAKAPTRTHPPVKRTMRDYWVMFCERWYWGLVPALIIGGVLAFLHFRKPVVFRSTATLQFSARDETTLRADAAGNSGLSTFVEVIRSGSFRDGVIRNLKPEDIELIRKPYVGESGSGPDIKAIIADAVEVQARRGAPFVDITATHRDGNAAMLIANFYARHYANSFADEPDTRLLADLNEIEKMVQRQRQRVDAAEAQLQEYRQNHPEIAASGASTLVAQNLATVTAQLNEAKRVRVQLESTQLEIDDLRRKGLDLANIPHIASYRSVANLQTEIEKLQADRALLERKYLENHPSMKANQLEIDAKSELLRRNIEGAVEELRTKYREARSNEERLAAEQKELLAEQNVLAEAAPALRELEAAVAREAELRDQYLKRQNEALLNRGMENTSVAILEYAGNATVVPVDYRQALWQGAIASAVLFLIVPVVFGISDSRLKAAWEVEQFLKENLLGEMPAIEGVARKERPHIMARDLDHGAGEAFRGLFGQLQLNSTVAYPKVLMLTSTLPGEGKSVVANNLAATFAGHGKKTLLVDCDFRRPNLHVFYGKDNACGVMRWLESNNELKAPALEDQDLGILPLQENFYLLRAGGESRRATELFEMESFANLLGGLRKQFDIVIVDTPPIGVFPDSMLLSRMVDEIAYVCRFNAVNRSKIRKCIERLRTPNAAFAGIILNGIPSGKQSAHYDYYGYGANEAKRYKAYYAQRR